MTMNRKNTESYVLPCAFEKHIGKEFIKSFKCFHLNIRSVKNKESDLCLYLEQIKQSFDAVLLTETWSTDETTVFRLPSYNTFYLNRSKSRGGGICILVKKEFTCELLQEFSLSTNDCEIMALKVENTLITVCYRPPSGSVSNFLDNLEIIFEFSARNRFSLVCGGDLNINILKNDAVAYKLNVLLKVYGLTNVIDIPTRVTTESSSLIDMFFTNIDTDKIKAGVLTCDLSDHLPIFICCKQNVRKICQPIQKVQRISEHALLTFRERIGLVDWDVVLSINDANTSYETFLSILGSIYECSFPYVNVKRYKKIRKPWVTLELMKRIQEKNKLYRRFIKSKDPDLLRDFKKTRNCLDKDLKKARCDYYSNLFQSADGRANLIWKRLNSVLKRNITPDKVNKVILNDVELTGKCLADAFNQYFVSISRSTAVHNDVENITRNSSSVFLKPVSEAEVVNIIRNLKTSTAKDIDDFQIKPIKYTSDLLAPILTHIFNLCLSQAVFPRKMQVARVTALHKKGNKNDMANYRPVSILPVMSKVLEKVILQRFTDFEEKHSLLICSQFGFRKGLSTEFALLKQKETISAALEEGDLVLGLFIDYSKAFDHINHQILIKKLDRYGFRGNAAQLITSYLEYRKQIVHIDDCFSDLMPISSGVPQGSILGPFLFNIYINDVVSISPSAAFIIYADDTSIFIRGSSADELVGEANFVLEKLSSWTEKNHLKINMSKTKSVIFRSKNRKVTITQQISLNSTPIDIVPNIKTLGVVFQENLSWNEHIDTISSKLSQLVGLVYRNRLILPRPIMILIYNSLFSSRINYCHLVWASTTQKNIQKIYSLQKRFLRAVENVPLHYHTYPLFEKYNVMPFEKIYNYRLTKSYQQEIKGKHVFLTELAKLNRNSQPYKTRNCEIWNVKTCRTTFGRYMLGNRLPRLLNALHELNFQLESNTLKTMRTFLTSNSIITT